MRPRPLLWQLYASYLLIVLVSLFGVTWYASRAVRSFYLERMRVGLEARARLLEDEVVQRLGRHARNELDRLCKCLGRAAATRITVILPTGLVVADSDHDPATMDNHSDRPEIQSALRGEVGSSLRYSYTLQKMMMYVAVPLRRDGRILAVLRVSVPATAIERALGSIRRNVVLVGLVAAALAAVLSGLVARRLVGPLREIERGAQEIARGNWSIRLPAPRSTELIRLVEVLNDMTRQINARVRTIREQRDELEALLAAMVEGVLALDRQGHIRFLNRAAADLLRQDEAAAKGRAVIEVARYPDFEQFVRDALRADQPIERDLTLRDEEERFVYARATPLVDAQGQKAGGLLVLRDVTEVRRLERVRREFVANVSHELKTPITSVKGAAETLRELADDLSPDARRFVEMLVRQADRLHAIVEDLLTLSRIEQAEEAGVIPLEPRAVQEVIDAAVKDCARRAEQRGVRVERACPSELTVHANASLLEQAVVNLVDNAIKYSEPGQVVRVEAQQEGAEVVIRVVDQGCGIPREHLPRLFERFYRVDKARSRKLGGTGLGLAIVKHIAQAHGGTVSVESEPGKGSTFTIHLPAAG